MSFPDASSGSVAAEAEGGGAVAADERAGTMAFVLVLLALGLFWIVASARLPSRLHTGALTQAFLPVCAGISLTVVAALLLVRTWRIAPRPVAELDRPPLFEPRAQLRVAAGLAALLVYIMVLPVVHYLLSTFVVMAVGLALTGEPRRPRLLLRAGVMSAIVFAIFVLWLQVPLPGSRFA